MRPEDFEQKPQNQFSPTQFEVSHFKPTLAGRDSYKTIENQLRQGRTELKDIYNHSCLHFLSSHWLRVISGNDGKD
jgi:hypothetical protein